MFNTEIKRNLAGLFFSLLMFVAMVAIFLNTPFYVAFWLQFVAMFVTYVVMSQINEYHAV